MNQPTSVETAASSSSSPPVRDTLDGVLSSPVYEVNRRRIGLTLAIYAATILSAVLFFFYTRFGLTQVQGAWVATSVLLLSGAGVGIYLIRASPARAAAQNAGLPAQSNQDVTNDTLIASYHQLTVRQSAESFRNSQIAMALGLIILVAGAWTVLRADDTISRVVVGGLAALGGTFTAFLSRTFLSSHERALEQVNYLFSQPLVSHYLAYSREVAMALSKDELRDSALEKVVDRSLDSATAAVATPVPHLGLNDIGHVGRKRTSTPRTRKRSTSKATPTASTTPADTTTIAQTQK
jgi:hypothetical protein